MTILRQTIILNTLADNAADAFVDANGNLQITGAAYGAPKATSCSLSRQNAVSESLGIVTTTFTAVSGATYVLKVFGGNAIQGGYNSAVKTYTYTATSSDTATTIGDVFRAFINADVNILNIVATGTATLICTAKTGFAEIFVTTTTANTSIVVTNAGVPSVGQGTVLASDLNFASSTTYGTFTAGATYTRWTISWSTPNTIAAPSSNSIANNEYVLFINNAGTASGSTAYTICYSDINSIYGTLTALQSGYRAIPLGLTGTPSAGSLTAGVQTVTSATLSVDNVVAGDYLIGASTSSAATSTISGTTLSAGTVTGSLAVGQILTGTGVAAGTTIVAQLTGTAGATGTYTVNIAQTVASTTITASGVASQVNSVVSNTTFVSTAAVVLAGVVKLFKWRNLPR